MAFHIRSLVPYPSVGARVYGKTTTLKVMNSRCTAICGVALS
jgi:hypothetical protein